ncbi:hypothetical protein C8R45DRAFT_1109481 [Mycena sanguinolenta]|nr:hypothetical protein C8R45DRAFT_1109481 [Mycena sanguinolenta]
MSRLPMRAPIAAADSFPRSNSGRREDGQHSVGNGERKQSRNIASSRALVNNTCVLVLFSPSNTDSLPSGAPTDLDTAPLAVSQLGEDPVFGDRSFLEADYHLAPTRSDDFRLFLRRWFLHHLCLRSSRTYYDLTCGPPPLRPKRRELEDLIMGFRAAFFSEYQRSDPQASASTLHRLPSGCLISLAPTTPHLTSPPDRAVAQLAADIQLSTSSRCRALLYFRPQPLILRRAG